MSREDCWLVLGPCPALAVATLRELGLSHAEIALYFRIDVQVIARLAATHGRREYVFRPCSKLPRIDSAQRRTAAAR